jgi:signal transduction histidine kinase
MGIAASEQVLIFEKFYRGRAQANRLPGTGMGLAIARAIVEAHHGTIKVASAPGEGFDLHHTTPHLVRRKQGRLIPTGFTGTFPTGGGSLP